MYAWINNKGNNNKFRNIFVVFYMSTVTTYITEIITASFLMSSIKHIANIVSQSVLLNMS